MFIKIKMLSLIPSNIFCEKAALVALKSPMQQKHGCVIVYNNSKIIAEGYNYAYEYMIKWETIFSIHAEIDAINKLKNILKNKSKDYIKKCTMYVVRIGTCNQNYPLKLSCPCDNCQNAINSIGIPRVCYSIDDNIIGEEYIPTFLRQRYKKKRRIPKYKEQST